jgi:hypothetical protein
LHIHLYLFRIAAEDDDTCINRVITRTSSLIFL